MNANAQIFLDKFTAAATRLTCVAWIDLHYLSPGTFSLVRCVLNKLIPSGVCDGFSETVILEHPAYVQIFKHDDGKSVDELITLLMGKISAFVRYAFVYVSNYLVSLAAL
jgi:hypothetical protein